MPDARPSQDPRLHRWPELDGLRAFAVLGVMAAHADLSFDGSYGVQVFFVLSGFLITTLLVREHDLTGRIDVLSFYWRRARRLFPALWLMFALVSVWAVILVPPPFGTATLHGVLYSFLYIGNWAQAFPTTFPWGWLGMIGQCWSLGVEEQFYVLWPAVLVLLVLRRTWNRKHVAACLLALAVADTVYRGIREALGTNLTYLVYATDMNLDGLLLGAALAFYLAGRHLRFPHRLRWLGLAAVGGIFAIEFCVANLPAFGPMALRLTGTWLSSQFRGGELVIGTLTAVAIWSFTQSSTAISRATFGSTVAVYLGRLSYSLYLWHFPVYVALGSMPWFQQHVTIRVAAKIFAPFVIAAASYHLVELPILKAGRRDGS